MDKRCTDVVTELLVVETVRWPRKANVARVMKATCDFHAVLRWCKAGDWVLGWVNFLEKMSRLGAELFQGWARGQHQHHLGSLEVQVLKSSPKIHWMRITWGCGPENRVSTSVLDDNDECECLRNTDIKVKEGWGGSMARIGKRRRVLTGERLEKLVGYRTRETVRNLGL